MHNFDRKEGGKDGRNWKGKAPMDGHSFASLNRLLLTMTNAPRTVTGIGYHSSYILSCSSSVGLTSQGGRGGRANGLSGRFRTREEEEYYWTTALDISLGGSGRRRRTRAKFLRSPIKGLRIFRGNELGVYSSRSLYPSICVYFSSLYGREREREREGVG